jgi:hypothetical protein
VESGCRTVLSIYNPASRCSLHERQLAASSLRVARASWETASYR